MQTFEINETKGSEAAHAARTAFQISGAVQLRRRTFSQPPSPIRFARSRQASTRPCTLERVANEVDNAVSVIDTATNIVVATVPTGD